MPAQGRQRWQRSSLPTGAATRLSAEARSLRTAIGTTAGGRRLCNSEAGLRAGLSAPLFWRCLRSTSNEQRARGNGTIGTALLAMPTVNEQRATGTRQRGKLKRAPRRESIHNSPSPCAAGVQQRRAAVQTVPPAAVSYELLNTVALALVVRQGRVDLGVCHGRGLSSARGTAKTEAPEMPVYLGTR